MTTRAARAMSRARWRNPRHYPVTCAVCGIVREMLSPRARYCSNRCRQRAKYRRMRLTATQP